MTDSTQRAAATERGLEQDALQRFVSDLRERKALYLGLFAAAVAVVVIVLITQNLGADEGPDTFTPV